MVALTASSYPESPVQILQEKTQVADPVPVSPGDLMVVPPRAIHTFENASKTEEAELYMTATPGYYIDCESGTKFVTLRVGKANMIADFRMLAQGTEDDAKLDEADQMYLMAQFGTFPPDIPSEP